MAKKKATRKASSRKKTSKSGTAVGQSERTKLNVRTGPKINVENGRITFGDATADDAAVSDFSRAIAALPYAQLHPIARTLGVVASSDNNRTRTMLVRAFRKADEDARQRAWGRTPVIR